MKLLKDIRDSLAGGITPKTLGGPRPDLYGSDDDDDNMPHLETEEEAALNKFKDKMNLTKFLKIKKINSTLS